MISTIVLGIVFVLIAVRQFGRLRLQIWQIMLAGALAVLVTGQISPAEALFSINPDVMFFLFAVFVIGRALEESGYLSRLSYLLFRKAKTIGGLIFLVLFGTGMLSALLMNDTIAVIGTPVVLSLAAGNRFQPKVLLLALAFGVTIGSVMSPIGNPQNLLVAVNGNLGNPFLTFLRHLLLPTVINLFLTFLVLRFLQGRESAGSPVKHDPQPLKDRGLTLLCKASLIILLALVLARIATGFLPLSLDFRVTYIAMAAALPIIAFSSRRVDLVRRIDWLILVFFASMFILMQSVWQSGFFQSAMSLAGLNLASVSVVLFVSVVVSQFVSNVPLVALYLPVLNGLGVGTNALMALAAGSTIAGNLSILGAASNVIIIHSLERRTGLTITLLDFVKVGLPVTAINVAVYWLFLTYV